MTVQELIKMDINKAHDRLQSIEFKINETVYKFYYKYMTVLENQRIESLILKDEVTYEQDGTKTVRKVRNNELYPVYVVLEKALDENGKRLFSHTDMEMRETLFKMEYGLLSYIASQMAFDVMGNIQALQDLKNKKD